MSISFKQLTYPTQTAITVDEALKHLVVTTTDEKELLLIESCIKAAEQYCESYTRRKFVVANFAAYLDSFPDTGNLIIQKSPVVEVTEIKYFDASGIEQTLSTSGYEVDVISEPARVRFKTMPVLADRLNAVCIKFSAGYANDAKAFDASLVPENIKRAMLLIIGHLYEHREQVLVGVPQTEIDFGVDSLLNPSRLFLF